MAEDNTITIDRHQKLIEAQRVFDQVEKDSTALWAISVLGELMQEVDVNAGFEGITPRYWGAIGVAIESMAQDLMTRDWVNVQKYSEVLEQLEEGATNEEA